MSNTRAFVETLAHAQASNGADWGRQLSFYIPKTRRPLEFDEQIVCQGVSLILEMGDEYDAAAVAGRSQWYDIVALATAQENGAHFAEIRGKNACSAALAWTMERGPLHDEIIVFEKNCVEVPLPFEFSANSCWHLNDEADNLITVELAQRRTHGIWTKMIVSATLEIKCGIIKRPTRRVILRSGATLCRNQKNTYSSTLLAPPSGKSQLRFVYFVPTFCCDEIENGQVCSQPVSAKLTRGNMTWTMTRSFCAWREALANCSNNGLHAASRLAALGAYVCVPVGDGPCSFDITVDGKDDILVDLIFVYDQVIEPVAKAIEAKAVANATAIDDAAKNKLTSVEKRLAALENQMTAVVQTVIRPSEGFLFAK